MKGAVQLSLVREIYTATTETQRPRHVSLSSEDSGGFSHGAFGRSLEQVLGLGRSRDWEGPVTSHCDVHAEAISLFILKELPFLQNGGVADLWSPYSYGEVLIWKSNHVILGVANPGRTLSVTPALGRIKGKSNGLGSITWQGHGLSTRNVLMTQQTKADVFFSSSVFSRGHIQPPLHMQILVSSMLKSSNKALSNFPTNRRNLIYFFSST